MALDAIVVRNLVCEFNIALENARIDKIHQPERDEIIMSIRTPKDTYKMVLSASAAHPRLHFTKNTKTNPQSPPMFCMLLRKHIAGGRIVKIYQPDFERVIIFEVESYNELGDQTIKRLIIEIMGRHSNIILVNSDNKIIDSIKHVDYTVSSVRQILPGLLYNVPPSQDKLNPLHLDYDSIIDTFKQATEGEKSDKFIMSKFTGISPIVAREIVYNATGQNDVFFGEINDVQKNSIISCFNKTIEKIKSDDFSPCIVTQVKDNKVIDFSAFDVKQYENIAAVTHFDSINELLNTFYYKRDADERMKQRSSTLVKLVGNLLERANKKFVLQQQTLKDAENKEEHKIIADLITANLYKIKQGEKLVELENYYLTDMPIIKVKLDPSLTPILNAQKYYKKYNKSKNAEIEVKKHLENTKKDIEYLESCLHNINSAKSDAELAEIVEELAGEGILSKRKTVKKNKQKVKQKTKPMHFISSDGFDIFVGKNNHQNDYLTLRFANTSDLWFHTKNIPGSHTIIKLGIDKNVPDATIIEAAKLAGYFSKATNSSQVPVDYTQIKNVKKPNGAKPGMVIYDHYNTMYIQPDENMVGRLTRID